MESTANNEIDAPATGERQSQRSQNRSSGRNRKQKQSQRSNNKSRASSNQRSQGSNLQTDGMLPPLSRAGIPQQRDHMETGVGGEEPANQLDDIGTYGGNENYMFDTGTQNNRLLASDGYNTENHLNHDATTPSRQGASTSLASNAKLVSQNEIARKE